MLKKFNMNKNILKRIENIKMYAEAFLKEVDLLELELGRKSAPPIKGKKKDNVKELFAKSQAKFLNSITIIKNE